MTLIFLTGKSESAYAQKDQKDQIDSLRLELSSQQEDTNKVNILNELCCKTCELDQYETAHYYAQQAKQLAEKLNFRRGLATCYGNIGGIYAEQIQYDETLKNYFTELDIRKTLGDQAGVANAYNNIGNVHAREGRFSEGLRYYSIALSMYETLADKEETAYTLNCIGTVYLRQGKYDDAFKHYSASLKINREISDKKGMAGSYHNIGSVYQLQGNYIAALNNFLSSLKLEEELANKWGMATTYETIGNIYIRQENYAEAFKYIFFALRIYKDLRDKRSLASGHNALGIAFSEKGNQSVALENYFVSINILKELDDKSGIATIYNNIGLAHYRQRNFDEALRSYFLALKSAEEIGTKLLTATLYNNIGDSYTALHQAKEGKKWLQKGLLMTRELGAKMYIRNSYNGLSATDSALGNYRGAYENYKMYVVYKDSTMNEDDTRKLTQAAMQYEFDKKEASVQAEQEKKDFKQRIMRNSAFGGLVVLMVFLLVVVRQRNKVKREKEKSETLLHNILPIEVADELKQTGFSHAKQFDEVSVMFTDFVNFTKATEILTPEELVKELHECFTTFDHIIERNNLEKIKTIGDAYLAVCGLPNANPQHAQQTVQAALEISDFMTSRKFSENAFKIRIGVHSGSVVAGIVGVKKFAYDIWGDTVNTASRMESNSEAGKVNISETTYQLVKEKFTCTPRGKINVKGKGEIDMYFVNRSFSEG